MSTRSLTFVFYKGESKVAQYSRHDGYPTGEGKSILAFLLQIDLEAFKTKLDRISFIDDEIESEGPIRKLNESKPWLQIKQGSTMLAIIASGRVQIDLGHSYRFLECEVDQLIDSTQFAADSLYCEWAYVIDLDKNTFEIYKGFNKEPLAEGERFKHLPSEGEYFPVKHVKTYNLYQLPTKRKFVTDMKLMLPED